MLMKWNILRAGACAVACALAACATTPTRPSTALFEVETAYIAALTVAVEYKNLPLCGPGQPVLCSDATVIDRLRTADAIAGPALDAAKDAVSRGGADSGSAIGLARQAVAILAAITASVAVH